MSIKIKIGKQEFYLISKDISPWEKAGFVKTEPVSNEAINFHRKSLIQFLESETEMLKESMYPNEEQAPEQYHYNRALADMIYYYEKLIEKLK